MSEASSVGHELTRLRPIATTEEHEFTPFLNKVNTFFLDN
jgi:hypothetical protein